jgi:peptide/nickel transport system permease protein
MTALVDPVELPVAKAGRGRRRRILGTPPVVALSFLILVMVTVCAVLGSHITPYDPATQNLLEVAQKPSAQHWLGTDNLGQDVLSRLMVGSRSALVGPLLIAIGSLLLGGLIGLTAGYRGGKLDAALMRTVDFVFAFPHLLVILVVGGLIGGGYAVGVLLLTVFLAPHVARIVRGAVLQQRELPYIEAARSIGVSPTRIMFVHLLPNVRSLALATAFVSFSVGLVALSSLSFLGVGVPPGTPDWGRMLVENRLLVQQNPWASVAPGLCIVLTAAAMNVVGDWLFENLTEDRG